MKRIAALLAFVSLFSCELNDTMPGDATSTLNTLTDGEESTKAWKISSATLTNDLSGSSLSISNLANVQDDEFIFSSSQQNGALKIELTWRKRNEIRVGANESSKALLDYYLSAQSNLITINEDGQIDVDDPSITVKKVSDNKLLVRVTKQDKQLSFELVARTAQRIPSTLNFRKLADISGLGLEQAAGFTGSMASNSLYIAYRSLEGTRPERIVKYNIPANTFATRDFEQSDFVTKELHIINDSLKVVGAQHVNTYTLDLATAPTSVPHNLTLTRFGSTVVDDNIFIFGGDLLHSDPSTIGNTKAHEIYKHDQHSGTLNLVGELPEPRFWAHGQIIDNKLYVFGGRKYFVTNEAEDDIFIYDMTSGQATTLKLPNTLHRTFASRYQNFIVVGGQREIIDGTSFRMETTFAFFDTQTNTYTQVPTSFTFSEKDTIYGLTVVGNKLYALKGTVGSSNFEIYEADL